MIRETILVIVLLYNVYTIEGNKGDLKLPDYEYYRNRHYVNKPNLRQKFLQRKNEKKAKEKQIELLNEYSKDTVKLNGVSYFLADKRDTTWDKIHAIEEGMEKIIAADGLSYVYKRDHFWRTWKRVKCPKKETKIICYKCNNNVFNSTCEKCSNSGFWTIEDEPPPCSIELFSLIDRQQACGVKFTQPYSSTEPCPVVMNFAEIMSNCDNPIKTSYRITRSFKQSKSLPLAICGSDEDYCQITTSYRIYKDYVVFKIININNDVIYSRLMKPGKVNYICVINCGRGDSDNNTASHEKVNRLPLSFNLLPKRSVEQETSLQKINMHNTTTEKTTEKNHRVKTKKAGNRKKTKLAIRRYEESLKNNLKTINNLLKKVEKMKNETDARAATESICTRLRKKAATTEDYEENDNASINGE